MQMASKNLKCLMHLDQMWHLEFVRIAVYTDGTVALPEAVVTPVNADTVARVSSNCIAAASDSTLPDEPPSLLVAVVSSDEPNTQSTVTAVSSGLPACNADVVRESAVVDVSTPVSNTAGFITSSSYAAITQSFLPSGSVRTDVDMVNTSDCLLHSVPDDDEEEMASDEQIEDWDQEVFDP